MCAFAGDAASIGVIREAACAGRSWEWVACSAARSFDVRAPALCDSLFIVDTMQRPAQRGSRLLRFREVKTRKERNDGHHDPYVRV